jgi:hypothetical protein
MTEEEAKGKWCPMAKVASIDGDGVNRRHDGAPNRGAICIASSCMAWRWDSKTTGYCGLAGRPAA